MNDKTACRKLVWVFRWIRTEKWWRERAVKVATLHWRRRRRR